MEYARRSPPLAGGGHGLPHRGAHPPEEEGEGEEEGAGEEEGWGGVEEGAHSSPAEEGGEEGGEAPEEGEEEEQRKGLCSQL